MSSTGKKYGLFDKYPVTESERAKIARVAKLHNAARTITDHYRADREAADDKEERGDVWRTYALAMVMEQERRAIGRVGITLYKKERDLSLPLPFAPHWASITDVDLEELELALIRARHKATPDA